MTREQQKIVEENHNLIYEFAHRKNLLIEEYYDILAIGLCKAVIAYKDNIGNFSTFANKCMETEVGMYWREFQLKKRIPDEMIVSGEEKVFGTRNAECDIKLFDTIEDNYNLVDDVVSNMNYSFLLDMLTDKEKLIVKYFVDGYTQEQIAKKFNTKQQNISYIIKRIKKKWSSFVDNN